MLGPQPLIVDINRMWRELALTPERDVPPAIERLVSHFRLTRANGGAEFASFRYEPHPVLDWFIRTSRLTPPQFDFVGGFVTTEPVRQKLSAIQISEALTEPMGIEALDVYEFEASIAREIGRGGAYRGFQGTHREAQVFAGEFVDAIEQDGHGRLFGFSPLPWTPWFHDIAWDRTWIGLHPDAQRIWILCVTDTD